MTVEPLPLITSDVSVETIVDSVVLSGISNSVIDVVMNEVPQELRDKADIQSVISQIHLTEREYIPLYRDWQNSGLFSEFHKTLFRLMGVLYLIGIIACLSLPLGGLALLGLIVVFVVYLYARWRVLRDIKQRLTMIHTQLVSQMQDFFSLQASLAKAKRHE